MSMTDESDELPGRASPVAAFSKGQPLSYVKSQKGLLLFAEVVLSLIILISFSSDRPGCMYVPITMMISSGLLLGAYATGVDKRTFTAPRWAQADLLRAVAGAVLYLASTVYVIAKRHGGNTGAACGVISVIVFAYDAYISLQQLRNVKRQQRTYNLLPT